MRWAAILVVAMLVLLPAARAGCGDADSRPSRSDSPQAPADNSPTPTPDQTPPGEVEHKPSESVPDQASPPAKEAEKPTPQKPQTAVSDVRKRRSRAHKPLAAPAAEAEPRKVVVHQGGASEPIAQILPGVTQEEAMHQREAAQQLLVSAESYLKKLAGRSLNPNQQEIVVQIRQYIDGARSALKESDTQRAHTLALKAYLLADDLAKH